MIKLLFGILAALVFIGVIIIFIIWSDVYKLPSNWSKTDKNSNFFLRDIDFTEGEYALYIKHSDHGNFVVTDKATLEANKEIALLTVSLLSYVPSEGGRAQSFFLYKDGQLFSSVSNKILKDFNIGTLATYGKPATQHSLTAPRVAIESKLTELKNRPNVLLTTIDPNLQNLTGEYSLTLIIPSIFIVYPGSDALNDSTLGMSNSDMNQSAIATTAKQNEITNCLQQLFSVANPLVVTQASEQINMPIEYVLDGTTLLLKDTSSNTLLSKPNLTLVDFKVALVSNDKPLLQKMSTLNYQTCATATNQNSLVLVNDFLKQAIAQSNTPNLNPQRNQVRLSGYNPEIETPILTTVNYSLEWVEINTP